MIVNGEGKLEVAQDEISSEVCEKCGAPMVVKTGRYGKFLACSNYPQCKNTKRILASGEGEKSGKSAPIPAGENCEKCGAPMVYRKGRFGPFMACSNYPKCRYTRKISTPKKKEEEKTEEKKVGGEKPKSAGPKFKKKKK